jgi:hypothetical protein
MKSSSLIILFLTVAVLFSVSLAVSGFAKDKTVTVEGKVYYLQGLEKSLQQIELNPNHTDVKITGKVKQTPGGWVLYVD